MKPQFWQRGLFLAEATIAVATSFMGSLTQDRSVQDAPTKKQVSQAALELIHPAPADAESAPAAQQTAKAAQASETEVQRP